MTTNMVCILCGTRSRDIEAKDAEIERLRSALESIADVDLHADVTEMAEAALEGREPTYDRDLG